MTHRLPTAIAVFTGLAFAVPGAWAMVDPPSFFAALATFEPYNQHFLQDIGAFQLGLGSVLLLAALARASGLAAALLGVGIGSALHTVSHVLGRNLGGRPETDIPLFGAITLLLLVGGWYEVRRTRELPA